MFSIHILAISSHANFYGFLVITICLKYVMQTSDNSVIPFNISFAVFVMYLTSSFSKFQIT